MNRPAPALRTGGFTLIELLTVVVLLGILAAIAIPNYQKTIYKAHAADILNDVHVVQVAYHQLWADGVKRARTAAWGRPSPDLVPYLPDGFSFSNDVADYRWVRVKPKASPWGLEMGMLRVRPKPTLRAWLVDDLAAMANQATIVKKKNQVWFYILP